MIENKALRDFRYHDLQSGQAYSVRVKKEEGYKYVTVLSNTVLEKAISEGWFGEEFYVGLTVSALNN